MVQASLLKGECFDCGSKQGYFKSIIETAIYHDEFGQDFKKYSQKIFFMRLFNFILSSFSKASDSLC